MLAAVGWCQMKGLSEAISFRWVGHYFSVLMLRVNEPSSSEYTQPWLDFHYTTSQILNMSHARMLWDELCLNRCGFDEVMKLVNICHVQALDVLPLFCSCNYAYTPCELATWFYLLPCLMQPADAHSLMLGCARLQFNSMGLLSFSQGTMIGVDDGLMPWT